MTSTKTAIQVEGHTKVFKHGSINNKCIGIFYIEDNEHAEGKFMGNTLFNNFGIKIINRIYQPSLSRVVVLAVSPKYFREVQDDEPTPEYSISFKGDKVEAIPIP